MAAMVAVTMALVATLGVMRHVRSTNGQTIEATDEGLAPPVAWGGRSLDPDFARLFRSSSDTVSGGQSGGIASRYRLVGVMLNSSDTKKSTAIIEQKSSGTQRRLRIGEMLEASTTIKSIAKDEVWVVSAAGEECLVREGKSASRAPLKGDVSPAGDSGPAVNANRFGGSKTGENRWEFSHAAIMNYYQELMDRPERLVKVFDSLAPLYNDKREIEGYKIQIEGEREFFNAVGLRQDDVVRSVNGIEMTNRRRAENLIRRFSQNDLDLVVIELERGGKPVKQIYKTH
jgi:type II secretion system protein C